MLEEVTKGKGIDPNPYIIFGTEGQKLPGYAYLLPEYSAEVSRRGPGYVGAKVFYIPNNPPGKEFIVGKSLGLQEKIHLQGGKLSHEALISPNSIGRVYIEDVQKLGIRYIKPAWIELGKQLYTHLLTKEGKIVNYVNKPSSVQAQEFNEFLGSKAISDILRAEALESAKQTLMEKEALLLEVSEKEAQDIMLKDTISKLKKDIEDIEKAEAEEEAEYEKARKGKEQERHGRKMIKPAREDIIIDIGPERPIKHNVLSKIVDKISKLEEHAFEFVNSFDTSKQVLALAILGTIIVDLLQSQITGETIIGRGIRAPFRLLGLIKEYKPDGIISKSLQQEPINITGMYNIRDLDGTKVYPGLNPKLIDKMLSEELGPPVPPPGYGEIGPPVPPIGSTKGLIPFPEIRPPVTPYDIYDIRPFATTPKPMLVPDSESSSSKPSSVAPLSSDGRFVLNDLNLTEAERGVLSKLFKEVISPLPPMGHIEPLLLEEEEPVKEIVNNLLGERIQFEAKIDLQKAPQHNLPETNATIFDEPAGWPNVPSQIEPQDIMNRIKRKKNKQASSILSKQRSTREDTRTQARRLKAKI